MLQKNERISIVMPTYNRVEDLRKTLQFMIHFGLQCPVFIVDGSSEEIKKLNQIAIQKLNHPSLHYSAHPEGSHVGLRTYEGIKKVQTPYCIVWADDDLLIPSVLEDCADFLDQNPDFAACLGKTLCLMKMLKPFQILPSKSYTVIDHLRIPLNIVDEEAVSRYLIYYTVACLGAAPLYYTLRRTADLMAAYSLVQEDTFYTTLETLINAQILARGKVKELSQCMGFRNYTNLLQSPPRAAIVENKVGKNRMGEAGVAYAKKAFVDFVSKNEKLSPEVVGFGFDLFFGPGYDPDKRSFGRSTQIDEAVPWAKMLIRIQFILNLFWPKMVGRLYKFDTRYLEYAAKLRM